MRSPACSTCSICARTSARNASTSAMRCAVLALQLVEQRQAVFDLLQAAGIGLQTRKVVAQAVGRLLDGHLRRLKLLAKARQRRIDAADIVEALGGQRAPAPARLRANRKARRRRCRRSPASGPGSAGHARSASSASSSPAAGAALSISLRWNSQRSSRRSFSCSVRSSVSSAAPARLPACVDLRDAQASSSPAAGKRIQHVALRVGRKQKLLIVLSVDIAQQRRQIAQQRDGHGTAAQEGARLAARQDLALDQQLAILDGEARRIEQRAHVGAVAHVEDARHARARLRRSGSFRPMRGRPAAGRKHPPRWICRCPSRPSADSAPDGSAPGCDRPRRSFRPATPQACCADYKGEAPSKTSRGADHRFLWSARFFIIFGGPQEHFLVQE